MAERLHFHFSLLCIGEGNGNSLQCSCLENPRDGVAQSRTRLKRLSSSSSKDQFQCHLSEEQSYFIQVLTANILIWGQLITIMNVENLVCW